MNKIVLSLIFLPIYIMSVKAQIDVDSRYIPKDKILQITIQNNYDKDIVILNSDGIMQRSEVFYVLLDINGDAITASPELMYHASELEVPIKSNEKYIIKYHILSHTYKALTDTFKIKKINVYHTIKFLKESKTDSTKKDYIIYRKEDTIFLDNTL